MSLIANHQTLKTVPWKLNLGANFNQGQVYFRVWAPKCQQIDVVIEGQDRTIPLEKTDKGYFVGHASDLGVGTLYRYCINQAQSYPDPCSRFQPEGPHGPSMIIDPSAYEWQDEQWKGIEMKGQVFYEMHIGSFTAEGTFDAAAQELEELKRLGITVIEIMPIAEFPGRWNQGYDGACLFAPSHLYGDPQAFKRFVNKAHSIGMAIVLDVVYNHFGPDGNYTGLFSDEYLSQKHLTAWGSTINYDGPGSDGVREFVTSNACYWINEFHVDGLRLDSTQDIHDDSHYHILAEISQKARESTQRKIVLIAENEPQYINLVHPVSEGGCGLDAVWNDDFHHAAIVSLTGRSEGYYTDYKGKPQEFISLYKRGYLYQGQSYAWQERPSRGTVVTEEPASAFIFYLQNHDQISNELRGERIHLLSDPALYRAMSAILLLAPETPLIFMGQEFASSHPFLFFADHDSEELAQSVSDGRKKFMEQFPSFASAYKSSHAKHFLPNPCSKNSFERSKLDFKERESNQAIYRLYHDLLKIRREDPIIAQRDRFLVDGAVLDFLVFVIRYFDKKKNGDDRLLLVNLGRDFDYSPIPEPLLAPSKKGHWEMMWSSDDPSYNGPGVLNPFKKRGWYIPAHSAILLKSTNF